MNKNFRKNLSFDFQDFKKWISEQDDLSKFFNIGLTPLTEEEKIIGQFVVAKHDDIKIKVIDGEHDFVLEEFVENGGTIAKVDGKKIVIEVDGGCFMTSMSQITVS